MYQPPLSYEKLLRGLRENEVIDAYARLLAQVELGFALLEFLELDDEPLTVLWAVLGQTPIHHPRLLNLSPEQRHALANVRLLVPYSGRVAWESALVDYVTNIPAQWRDYQFEAAQLEDQIVNAARREPSHFPDRRAVYQACLRENFAYREKPYKYATLGTTYEFEAVIPGNTVTLQITMPEELPQVLQAGGSEWCGPRRPGHELSVSIDELEPVAEFLDARETQLEDRGYGGRAQWRERHAMLSYSAVDAASNLSARNSKPLVLNGFTHLAGMVASGKSTLAILLAACAIQKTKDLRITLVVGDSLSALKLANQFNWWFCNNPETDTPVAVPLLGRTTRETHLARFYESEDFKAHYARRQPHWGERWLGTACSLQGLISPNDLTQRLGGKLIIPGHEPCGELKGIGRTSRDTVLCPFFGTCPARQLYNDMPAARIWITTPGAMAHSTLPDQIENRTIRLGELVYEQSDLVIFDEVDAVAEWFDQVYAEETQLTNGKNGVLDDLDIKTADYYRQNRISVPPTQRWIGAERDALKAVSHILTQLYNSQGQALIQEWVERGFFTAQDLFYRLAKQIAATLNQKKALKQIVRYFESLAAVDPLRLSKPNGNKDASYELARIMQYINNIAESATDLVIHEQCRDWLGRFVPALKDTNPEIVHQLDVLAYRLEFALSVALLDRHSQIVFWEWDNRPAAISGEQPHRRIPPAMLDILPLPVTGRQFGTYVLKFRPKLGVSYFWQAL